MRHFGICALTLLVALHATPAAAQDTEIGSLTHKRAPVPVQAHSTQQAVLAWHAYARCVTERRSTSVRRLFEVTTRHEVQQILPSITREVQCNITPDSVDGMSLSAPFDVQRGMYAEALLAKMNMPLGLPALPRVNQYHSDWINVSGRDPSVEEMAVCVAATNPAGIEALLRTEAESPQEVAAVQSLVPSFGTCLASNVRLTANRLSMRAALAEALYHRAMAPAVPAVANAPEVVK